MGGVIMLSAFMFISCEKDDALNQDAQNLNSESQLDKDIQILPFFEVAKGDTISKGVYREKPEWAENEENEMSEDAVSEDDSNYSSILRSSESEPEDQRVLIDIQVRSFNKSTDAPSYYYSYPKNMDKCKEWLHYGKWNYDLNKGAGGKYIYFYTAYRWVSKKDLVNLTNSSISSCKGWALRDVVSNSYKRSGDYTESINKTMANTYGFQYEWHKLGTNGCGQLDPMQELMPGKYSPAYYGTGKQVDLNEGAGGKYIYIWGSSNCRHEGYIHTLMLSNGRNRRKDGYERLTGDLNDGAGGKYIYLHCKRY